MNNFSSESNKLKRRHSQLLVGNIPQPLVAEGRNLNLDPLVKMDRIVFEMYSNLINYPTLLECQRMNLFGP